MTTITTRVDFTRILSDTLTRSPAPLTHNVMHLIDVSTTVTAS